MNPKLQLPADLPSRFSDYPREGFELQAMEIFEDTTEDMIRSQSKLFTPVGAVMPDLTELKR